MKGAFDKDVIAYADGMGISLYQRFSVHEASLFLRIQQTELEKLIKQHNISFIQLTKTDVQFFGFQLIDYLLQQTHERKQIDDAVGNTPTIKPSIQADSDRILRFEEVKERVGLSRTTIWRKEKAGEFPARVSLGTGSVGWKKSEIDAWVDAR